MKFNQVKRAAFASTALMALTWSASAMAQTTQAAQASNAGPTTVSAEEAVAEDVVVTGSRVRGVAPVGSTVTTLGRDDVVASGALSTDRLIKQIPQVFDLGVSENSRNTSGGNGNIAYGNSVNLRGIGPFATLVLLDGHRVVNNSRAVDPSVIPTLGLERVEVVADGASAIYGSDAVAGVVNLIPRRSLEGVEGTARYGWADGGYYEYQVGAAVGHKWSQGQLMVAMEHAFRTNLTSASRNLLISDQRAYGGPDYRVTRCNPGTITAGGTTYAIPAAGVTQATAATLIAGTTNLCDDIMSQDLFPQQEYTSANMTFTQDLGANLQFFADGFWSRRQFVRIPAEQSATLTVPQTNAFFVRPVGFAGTSYTIAYNFYKDLPDNVNPGSAENWEITPGIRWKIGGGWEFEALYTYGRGDDEANQYRGLNSAALNTALASSDPAVAFDPYGLGRTSAATLAAISNFQSISPTRNWFNGYEARINGSLFELPGGSVKLAGGYERQEIQTDLGSSRGVVGSAVAIRHFERQVDSGYAELLVPVFGPGNATPGFERLEIDAAVRYDQYSDVGKTTNPKFGVNWTPIHGLTLRGSYGTSFRAPLISQIYGNSNNLFVQSYTNPAGPVIVGVALSGPNLNLKPETATTWSLGADWDATPNLRMGVTYFHVKYANQIDSYLGDLNILSRESQFAGTGIILRDADAVARVNALLASGITLSSGVLPVPVTLFVDGRNNNLGVSYTEGLDFTLNYHMPTASIGSFDFNASGTYLLRYVASITPNGVLVDRRNTIFNPLTFKGRASLVWSLDPVRVQLTATHVGGYDNNAIATVQAVKSYTPIDLSVSWKLGNDSGSLLDGLTLSGEVRNMFNIRPPYVNIAPTANGNGAYDATASNPIGRLVAVSLHLKY